MSSENNGKLTWTNERRKLSDLIPWPRNPRQIKGDQAKRLVQSFDEFGQVEAIAIGPGNEVYNGHQRLNVLAQQYGKDYEVEVRVSSRALEEKEREKLTVFLHKGAAGEWDFDTLSEWDMPDLLEWGFRPYELGLAGDGVDYDEAWKGMPEFENEDSPGYLTLIVHVETHDAMERLAELIEQTITEKTKTIWYPRRGRNKLVYKDES